MYERHEIGKIGEEIVAKYLSSLDYKIIERNFECKRGEIDIIAIDKDELVFIEVKTRTNVMYGRPSEAVNEVKKKHIYKATEYYVYIRNLENEKIRLDVIEVYKKSNKYVINHIKKAITENK